MSLRLLVIKKHYLFLLCEAIVIMVHVLICVLVLFSVPPFMPLSVLLLDTGQRGATESSRRFIYVQLL